MNLAKASRFIASLVGLCLFSLALLLGRIVVTDSSRYIFLLWNLALAVIPLALAWLLVAQLRRRSWLDWRSILLSFLWLSFLPNSFYLITDFVHLRPNYEADLVFDIVLLSSFLLAGLALGFLSVYLVHREIIKRLRPNLAIGVVAVIFFISSFAVYLGRFNRFNSWDILLRPAGLLFDVSERVINPSAYSQTYLTTFILFGLFFSLYLVIWEAVQLSRRK